MSAPVPHLAIHAAQRFFRTTAKLRGQGPRAAARAARRLPPRCCMQRLAIHPQCESRWLSTYGREKLFLVSLAVKALNEMHQRSRRAQIFIGVSL